MPQTELQPHFSNYNSQQPFPNFQRPQIITGFSLSQERDYIPTRKHLKYLRLPDPGSYSFDLNLGYDSYVPGPKEVKLTSLQQFIKANRQCLLDNSGKKLAADFVCYRGLLTQICITPYFPRDSWSITASRSGGSIYLCNYESPEKERTKRAQETDYSRKCSYYGKNFERFILTGEWMNSQWLNCINNI